MKTIFALCALFAALACLTTAPRAHAAEAPIDMQRVRELHARVQKGEKLSPEEEAYYERGKAARKKGQPSAEGDGGKTKLGKPDLENQQYGVSKSDVLDLWKAKSDQPTPFVIFIHGGGFAAGDKRATLGSRPLEMWLEAKISVASINYRLSGEALAPAAMYDGARAVQFLRSKARE